MKKYKVLLIIAAFVLLVANGHALDETTPVACYDFNQDFTDEVGHFDLTQTGTVNFVQEGFLDYSIFTDLDCDNYLVSTTLKNEISEPATFCTWFRANTTTINNQHFLGMGTSTTGWYSWIRQSDESDPNELELFDDVNGNPRPLSVINVADNAWHFACFGFDDTRNYLWNWADGSVRQNLSDSDAQTMTGDFAVMCPPQLFGFGPDYGINGVVTQVIAYNFTLMDYQMDNLYNSGSGQSCVALLGAGGGGGETPSITLNTNLSSYINSTDNPYFFSIDAIGAVVNHSDVNWNVTMYFNGTVNFSRLVSNLNTTAYILNLTYGSQEVGYDINVTVVGENATDSFLRLNVFLDSVTPDLTWNWTNNSILYRDRDGNASVQLTGTDPNLFYIGLNLSRYVNGTKNVTIAHINTTDINLTAYTLNFSYSIETLGNGRYAWEGMIADSHTCPTCPVKNMSWYFDEDDNLVAENSITWEGGFKKLTGQGNPATYFFVSESNPDRYKLKMTFEEQGLTHTINISSPDLVYRANDGYKGHFVYLPGLRWIDHEGQNIKSVDVTPLGSNKFNLLVEHYTETDEIEFESIGDLSIVQSVTWFNVTQGMTFTANDTISGVSISNFTIYVINGTTILNNESTTDGNITINLTSGTFRVNITATGYTDNQTDVTFSSNGSFNFELFAENSLYLFFYDEDTDALIDDRNVTVQVLGPSSANQYLTDTGSLFIAGFDVGSYELRYFANAYRTNAYFTSIATSSTQQIDLYLVKNATSNLIVFRITDEKGNPIFNATLKGMRFFLADNAYLITSMGKTDNNGETGLYLVPNDVFYQFVVDQGGATVFRGTPQKIFSSTQYLSIQLLEDVLESLKAVRESITTSLTYNNNTNLVSYFFNDASGLVLTGCVEVIGRTIFTESLIQQSCVDGNSATIIINMSGILQNGTTYIARGSIETNTTSSTYLTDIIEFYANQQWKTYGDYGLFLGYIFVATMFFVGLPFNFGVAMIYSVVSLITLQLTGVTYFGWVLIATVSILGLIVAVVNKI